MAPYSGVRHAGVRSIPTMIPFERGDPVEVFAGTVASPKLERGVERHA